MCFEVFEREKVISLFLEDPGPGEQNVASGTDLEHFLIDWLKEDWVLPPSPHLKRRQCL